MADTPNATDWHKVLADLLTVLRFVGVFFPPAAEAASIISFAQLILTVASVSGRGIDVQDPNYNAPVGNSPATI